VVVYYAAIEMNILKRWSSGKSLYSIPCIVPHSHLAFGDRHFVLQAGLKLTIFLPQPPQCCGYRCTPPCPICWILRDEHMNKVFTSKSYSWASARIFVFQISQESSLEVHR
jgi:hypothetical protein